MTHFYTGVVVPKATAGTALLEQVQALLETYNENTEVEPYEADCWCGPVIADGRLSPDFECPGCKGARRRMTRYNPRSQWDFWSVGGRYDGRIQGQNRHEEDRWRDGNLALLPGNTVSVEELIAAVEDRQLEQLPRALVLPEGVWLERGPVGWFGATPDDDSQEVWIARALTALRAVPDGVVVGVDCHI